MADEHWDEDDPRLQFLSSYVVLALKSRNEKWSKMVSTEDTRQMILDFFEKSDAMLLVVVQHPGGHLSLQTTVPASTRNKAVYFLKNTPCSLNKTDFGKILLCGDMYGDFFEQHCSLVNEAMSPLLCSKSNELQWPTALSEDVRCEVHELKSFIYRIRGDIKGKTFLPLPANIAYLNGLNLNELPNNSTSDPVLRQLLRGIEAVTVKWNHQIQTVLGRTSEAVFQEDKLARPDTELEFWKERCDNLKDIFTQLSDPQAQKMADILKFLKSSYSTSFKTMFERLQSALKESEEISHYLLPLKKHFELVEQTNFSQVQPLIRPLLHTVCLVWVHAATFSSSYLMMLLRKICNLLVEMCTKYLDPARIFRGELEESVERIQVSSSVLAYFVQVYGDYKKNLRSYFPEENVRPWLFPESLVFEVYELFVQRLCEVEDLFHTAEYYMKLEKVCVGGIKGTLLSSRIWEIYQEFQDLYSAFGKESYNALDPLQDDFNKDNTKFKEKVIEFDHRIATVMITSLYCSCSSAESAFKLLLMFGPFLHRLVIYEDFNDCHGHMISLLRRETRSVREQFDSYVSQDKKGQWIPAHRNMPLVSATLMWMNELKDQLNATFGLFYRLKQWFTSTDDVKLAEQEYVAIIKTINRVEKDVYEKWAAQVMQICAPCLQQALVVAEGNDIYVNFAPELMTALKDVAYVKRLGKFEIPKSVAELYEQSPTFHKYQSSLQQASAWYNELRATLLPVEESLIASQLDEVDRLICTGRNNLSWTSCGVEEYVDELRAQIGSLYERVCKSRANVKKMRKLMDVWTNQPLFIRKEDKLLNLEDRPEKVAQRYHDLKAAGESIHDLLDKNRTLFHANVETSFWEAYTTYVDDLIGDRLVKVIDTSLQALLALIDPSAKKQTPAFEIKLDILDCRLTFSPHLSEDSGGLPYLIGELFYDVFQMATLVSCLARNKEGTYLEEIKTNETLQELVVEKSRRVRSAVSNAHKYLQNFEPYAHLWTDKKEDALKEFLEQQEKEELPGVYDGVEEEGQSVGELFLEKFQLKIEFYKQLYAEVEKLQHATVVNEWLRISSQPLKQSLLRIIEEWSSTFEIYLLEHVTSTLAEFEDFVSGVEEAICNPVNEDDKDALISVLGHLIAMRTREFATAKMFEPLHQAVLLLKNYGRRFPEQIYLKLQELPERWNFIKKTGAKVKQQVAPLVTKESALIRQRAVSFDRQQQDFRKSFQASSIFCYDCENPFETMDKINRELSDIEEVAAELRKSASLFEVVLPEFRQLQQCRNDLQMLREIWDFVFVVRDKVDGWKSTLWTEINLEEMDMACKRFAQDLRSMEREYKTWKVFMELEAIIKNLLASLRAVGELQNTAVRERHWQQLMMTTKVSFEMNDEVNLADLLALNLHEYEDEVKSIVDRAVKESGMERVLKELDTTWAVMKFEHDHHSTGLTLLRASEELIETLEDNQVQLQNLMTSKYITHFLDEISCWQHKLSIADQVIGLWFEVQSTWSHLESIFIGSKDIRKQLPQDTERFEYIDSEFRTLVKSIESTTNVIEVTNKSGLFEKLEDLQSQLLVCEKALAEYLETKRLAFPRFYFVSSADLLDILSNGNRPHLVARHLNKLFDAVTDLKLTNDEKEAVGMYSKDGEYVDFIGSPCDCTGPVEVWLARLLDKVRYTIRSLLTEAVATYEERSRDQWLCDYCAQVALCGSQIWWTSEVTSAFARLEEGYENALKEYNKKQVHQLNTLIALLLGKMNPADRQKVMTICTIDVHSRDVVAKMVAQKVESASEFIWLSQLRHWWDEKEGHCMTSICDAQFRYSYEYLGNTPRLVITPLTDRCYITLTQSLHLIMGGAPAGPAGTGKTETTKDLGRSLGVMVYVFNCSEQMDYKSCGNIYKGLAQTGTWGCFDEFNRISVEVLSVIAVQVKCVQDALREKKTDFNFFGEIIPLDPFVGIFVTMNPGYAGRAELPENLKTLFRPCAMVVPDYELICEIMLVAEGFIQAKFLARKFITLYTLCKELLSQQDHYDWGLRAIKSVLVVAGTLKRADPDRPEEQILMRALRDFNVPKIVSDDVSVFVGLIGDLFPTLDVPRKMDEDFEEAIKKAAVDLKLQPEEHFLLKVIQLEELLQVRHSVFVIGATGTGKSQVCRTLLRTYQNLKRRPVAHDLNPKAVTNDELFGAVNPQTREWKDGLLSVLIRDLTNISGDGPKWIILDGDIDPMWIESLNSVMDDNKVLTLASNERISLTPSMRLVFEISTLQHASPATVSRAGILYMNPSDLSWNLYITSWIEAREVQSEKANLVIMVDKYVPPCLEILRLRFKKIVPIPEISHVQMLCYLLDCLLTPENIPSDSPKELYEQFFVFACIWAFGAALYQDHLINYRAEFSKWWSSEFKYIKFPSQGTVFDYFIDPETKKFVMWSEKLPAFSLDLDLPLQATLVHTAETVQLSYFLELLMSKRHPVMLAGNAGCGKTLLINWKLSTLSENYTVTKVPFNFYTTSGMLQKILEKPLEKKAGRNYGPPGNKQLVYFIDDMNMPEVDAYGTVQPHTLIHQHLDYGHWYDRVKLTPKDIRNCQYVTCMNPTAGSFTINSRLQRHFCVFAVCNPGMEALTTIYKSILGSHLEGPQFSPNVQRAATSIVATALILHQKVAQMFLPSATRFHYVFNLRDLSNIFQGLLFSTPDVVKTPNDLARIWMHETQRVYRDKLVDEKDIESFNKTQQEVVKKNVEEVDEARLQKQPLLYFHFAHGLGQPKYQSVEEWPTLHTILQEALNSYNDVNPVMNLVLFEDAMQHVCRISRILQAPRGNALLVGVGGSGKQSLARLAAFINGLEVFQISLHRDYGISDLKSDLAMLQVKAGQKNVGIVLLMTDAHIADEGFLVPINDFLASGEIPELFSDDEIENVVQALRNEVKNAGMVDSRENCWKFFLDRVRRQMKIVLCFSPVGSTLRVRSRKFPAIVNCTCVDWFHPWPKEALLSVSDKFLQDLEVLPGELRVPVAEFMAYVQTSVKDVSLLYLANEGRHNHSTPKTYLEQIHLYKSLLRIKHDEFQTKIMRLENGLQKLLDTATQVNDLKVKLAHQETELQRKNEDADRLIEIVREETEKVSAESAVAAEEEKRVAKINDEVTQRQKDCQEDLLKAEPNLIAAREALNTLNKANLTELKSFGSPPAAVTNVIAAVMVLLASDGKIPKDRSWRAAKISMSKVDSFLDSLVNFDKEHIHDNCLKAIQPYLQNPEFRAENVASKSQAAAGLCSWVINIIKFYEVYCDIEPKRRALEAANAELLAATEKLNEIKEKIVVLEETLDELKRKYEEALADKLQCQKEAEETTRTIVLANRLVDGLASEKVRWAVSVGQLHEYQKTLPGDVLIAVAFVSYIGCFTKQYRNDLLFKYWLPYLRDQKSLIPVSVDFDPVALLTDDTTFAEWHNEGLPGDRMSAENATIFTISERWPLLIDPQLQGSKWIKVKFGDALKILRLGQKGYLELLEQAISSGDTVLLENIAENVDPVLDALIGRNTIKRGRAIKIGDKEVDYNQNFRLILHTKLSNPHYKPEMQAQTVLINFTVTQDGLEDQLLAEVVSKERPDLEQQKLNLTKQQNDFKILLKKLEDTLLQRLSAAEGNFVSDSTLVENLETTKATAAEIEMKVIESRETEAQINQAREIYRSVAIRAALLYFILKDLHKINPLYQFSLKSFGEVFHKAIANTPAYDAINRRVSSLINNITYSVYTFTTRGLFEKDKLIFSTQLALQILLRNGDVDPMEFDFLLRFPVHSHVTSPVDFLSDYSWGGLKSLSLLEEFHLLDRDVENSSKRWKKLVDSECPENEKLPQEWKSKTSLQRLCILRCLRPDRMIHGITNFVKENLGSRYVESSSIDLNESYKETAPNTAVFFILSPGVDPLKDVEKLGKQMGFTAANKKLHSVSLGQGQEKVAEKALNAAMTDGSWVILQNIHLVKKWLPTLEKMLEMSNQGCHQDFRAFISAEPADCPENHIIPQGILESSIKITNEPPTGMHANLHKALSNFNQETLEKCSHEMEFKSILFSLCYFHAVVTERRRFGPQGWNRAYPFGVGDLTISINVLYNYLETATKIPWQDLRYLFGEIMYGGHITDDWDRRLCLAYLEEYMQPAQLEGEVYLAPGFPVPPNLDYVGYQRYIDEMLPSESPYLYGLHPNAEIGFLASTSDNLFSTLLELQPRRDGAGVSSTREEKIKQTLDDIAEKLPEEFNITELINKTEEKTPYTVVALQECERMNILTREIRKSLHELDLGLKGELTITSDMEELGDCLFLDHVPPSWTKKAYPSQLGLGSWFANLLARIKELDNWCSDFSLPPSVWLPGLFNPQSFLTAIMQTTARKNEMPLDKMCLLCDVTKKTKEEFTHAPREGAYIHGLFMEGARWDVQNGCIVDSQLKELYYQMPVIFARAILSEMRETRNMYECPVYRTKARGPTYVWTFDLPTREKISKWTLAGVALLLEV